VSITTEDYVRLTYKFLKDWDEYCHEMIMHMNHPGTCQCDKWCRRFHAPWQFELIAKT
jgi:hypothetical protein